MSSCKLLSRIFLFWNTQTAQLLQRLFAKGNYSQCVFGMILHLQTSEERKINGINLIVTQNVMIFSSERENRIMLRGSSVSPESGKRSSVVIASHLPRRRQNMTRATFFWWITSYTLLFLITIPLLRQIKQLKWCFRVSCLQASLVG